MEVRVDFGWIGLKSQGLVAEIVEHEPPGTDFKPEGWSKAESAPSPCSG